MPEYIIPPAGVSPASFAIGIPVVAADRPPAILAENIDPRTKEIRSVFVGTHPVDAAIEHQWGTTRGSGAAVLDKGHRFRELKKNDAAAPEAMRHEALRIMKPFVDAGDIEIEQIAIRAGEDAGDLGASFVAYRNLRTHERRKLEF